MLLHYTLAVYKALGLGPCCAWGALLVLVTCELLLLFWVYVTSSERHFQLLQNHVNQCHCYTLHWGSSHSQWLSQPLIISFILCPNPIQLYIDANSVDPFYVLHTAKFLALPIILAHSAVNKYFCKWVYYLTDSYNRLCDVNKANITPKWKQRTLRLIVKWSASWYTDYGTDLGSRLWFCELWSTVVRGTISWPTGPYVCSLTALTIVRNLLYKEFLVSTCLTS